MPSLPENYQRLDISSLPRGPEGDDLKATKEFGLSHTMIRVKDPIKSIDFYTRIIGMNLIHEMPMEKAKFTNYFLCFPQRYIPTDPDELRYWMWSQQALLELCHNWGTENDPNFKHCSGNEPEHKGFGHLCIFVPDLLKACERFGKLGVQFKKRPHEGSMKEIAFILDPDGYWIEVVQKGWTYKTTS